MPQFHFEDDSDDTNESEREEIKALEMNSTSNDQKDSHEEMDNWNLEKTDSIEKRLSDVKIRKREKYYWFQSNFQSNTIKKI